MMKPLLATVLSAIVITGCVDRADLFGSRESRDQLRLRLPAGLSELYEQDTVRIGVEGGGAGVRVQVLLLDSARAVLWRSPALEIAGGSVDVPVGSLPPGIPRGRSLLVSASAAEAGGTRIYASDDSTAALRLEEAAVRTARLWAGRRVSVPGGATPMDAVLAPELARAFFTVVGGTSIGVLDLSGEGEFAGTFPLGVRPALLSYRAGVLAALGGGGGEISFVRPGGPAASRLLPALELEMDTTFAVAVRPTGSELSLGCAREQCSEPYAAIPSGIEVLRGSDHGVGGAGVLRLVSAPGGGPDDAPPLVLPGYADVLQTDTSAPASVFAPREPDGSRGLLHTRSSASRCLTTALGAGKVAAGHDGVLYVAVEGAPCGPGTALLRIEAAASEQPAPSVLAIRNTLAEHRLGRIDQLRLAGDGGALLVLGEGNVVLLDVSLRLRGVLRLPAARAVAWLEGGAAERFAVAETNGIAIYDAKALTPIAHVPVGPTAGPLLYLRGSGDAADLLVAATASGFVVARVPLP